MRYRAVFHLRELSLAMAVFFAALFVGSYLSEHLTVGMLSRVKAREYDAANTWRPGERVERFYVRWDR